MLKTSRGAPFLPPSDVYVKSFNYLFYTLLKLYYTKALSDQASSLSPWIESLSSGGQESWRLSRSSNNLLYPVQYSWASLVAQLVKNPTCNVEDLGSIPGLGRSPGEEKGYPLQYSGLENSMDYTVHGVAKSWTWLSDFHFIEMNKKRS